MQFFDDGAPYVPSILDNDLSIGDIQDIAREAIQWAKDTNTKVNIPHGSLPESERIANQEWIKEI